MTGIKNRPTLSCGDGQRRLRRTGQRSRFFEVGFRSLSPSCGLRQ